METQTEERTDSTTDLPREDPESNIATAAEAAAAAAASDLPDPVIRRGIDEATWRSLKNSIYPGARSESICMAVDYCRARKLDVLKKPCHIVPMEVHDKKTNTWAWRDIIMPGIYEYRITAMRTGTHAGDGKPEFGPEIEYLGVKAPEFCTYTVLRFVAGHKVPFSATVYFTEAVAHKDKGSKVNAMWTKRPRGQLEKCAEAAALRRAFPEELGGEHIADEFGGGEGHGADASVVADVPPNQTRTASAAEALRAKLGPVQPAGEDPTKLDPGGAIQRELADQHRLAESRAAGKSRADEWADNKQPAAKTVASAKTERKQATMGAPGLNTALTLIRAQNTLEDLENAYNMLCDQYIAAKVEIPIDLEALHRDRKEFIEMGGDQ